MGLVGKLPLTRSEQVDDMNGKVLRVGQDIEAVQRIVRGLVSSQDSPVRLDDKVSNSNSRVSFQGADSAP